MAVDLRQVAQHSGVSVSTASRALSGSTRVSDGTVAKVRAAAAALGYRPNASARALRTARSQFIGQRSSLRILIDHNAAGVIVVGSDSEATEELRERGTPTVHLARRPKCPNGPARSGGMSWPPAAHTGQTRVLHRFVHGPGHTGLSREMQESPDQADSILRNRLGELRKHMTITLEGMAAS